MRKISIIGALLLIVSIVYSQDNRTINTRVADLLARMPVYNGTELIKQMEQMSLMGQEGRNIISGQVVEAGTGDDTRERFAIESYSRHLSDFGKEAEREIWEEECIAQIKKRVGYESRSFFLNQLVYIGRKGSSQLAAELLTDPQLCEPALAVIDASRTKGFDKMLADMLSIDDVVCAAGIMNLLADWNPDLAIDKILKWYKTGNSDEKRAALNAMSRSTSKEALKVLTSAAQGVNYSWEETGAVSALLGFADNAGSRGDIETLRRVTYQLINRPANPATVQYKTTALSLLVKYTGLEALDKLEEALLSGDLRYRIAAIRFASEIEGSVATRKYISLLSRMPSEIQADIITMLGSRGDYIAAETIKTSLFSSSMEVREASAMALSILIGSEAADELIDYMKSFPNVEDQRAGMMALSLISDENRRSMMSDAIETAPDLTKANLITLVSFGGDTKYFDQIAKYCSSTNLSLRGNAFMALQEISGPDNLDQLIEMLNINNNNHEIELLKMAIARGVLRSDNRDLTINKLRGNLNLSPRKSSLISVLPLIGGRGALQLLMEQFESGTTEIREVCFSALLAWPDPEVVYQLFALIQSENKTYESVAFSNYLIRVTGSDFTPEQKLLLFRKVMPLAKSEIQKSEVLSRISDINTLQAFWFVAGYIDHPELKMISAKSLIRIAIASKSSPITFKGEGVKEILKKAESISVSELSEPDIQRLGLYISESGSEEGFVSMFNGKDLSGWQGLVENPLTRAKMNATELASKQRAANIEMARYWSVKDGAIYFSGDGANLCSIKDYGDFEMFADWKITKKGDSGIYLRGTPQVQIWDTSRVEVGAQVGSGGLYNNSKNVSKPLLVADNPVGDWNTLRILMRGEIVSVWLNGILVVDNIVMENYWDRSIPIFPKGPIELQAHGNELAFRDIFIREISSEDYSLTPDEKSQGFVSLFNGRDLNNWVGNKESYIVDDGVIVVKPEEGSGGNLYTESEYSDFNFRFEFQLTPGANNGLGIRTPLTGDAAYVGMELQILDNSSPIYANLEPYQYHGSVYGVIPALRGMLKPVGEWNSEEVIIEGSMITIILNGNIILSGDISDGRDNGTMDHRDHPGLSRSKGHIGFLGHGSLVRFRNIRIKEL